MRDLSQATVTGMAMEDDDDLDEILLVVSQNYENTYSSQEGEKNILDLLLP